MSEGFYRWLLEEPPETVERKAELLKNGVTSV